LLIPAQAIAVSGTVPAGKRWLVKNITYLNNSGAARVAKIKTNTAGAGAVDMYWQAISNGVGVLLPLGLVLNAGDVLTLTGDSTGMNAAAYGIEFTL
jgi:hypothetical protein